MNWPWSKPRPPPAATSDVLSIAQESKDEMTAASEQLRDVVAELRAVVDEFERVTAERRREFSGGNGK